MNTKGFVANYGRGMFVLGVRFDHLARASAKGKNYPLPCDRLSTP